MHISNENCVLCKGRFPKEYCGRTFCPIIARNNTLFKVKENTTKESFSTASPAPFIGRFGYPDINVGILAPQGKPDNIAEYDDPRHWAIKNYDIPNIVDFRSSMVNSRFNINIKGRAPLLDITQEVGMAGKPVDVEINLKKKPTFRINTESIMAPTGPNALLKDVKITSNPKISSKVDKVVSDTDLNATDAMSYLYEKGFDENFLQRLLSVGTIGEVSRRKLVPTRWAITASDDSLGKYLIKIIKDFEVSDYTMFFGGYLGNYYLIMLFPEPWSYELFETSLPGGGFNLSDTPKFVTDNETYNGRKNYAFNTAGGYYAARMPILERLRGMKRQASVLCMRFITNEYVIPLGVWVCREASRKTVISMPMKFNSTSEMIKAGKELIKSRFNFDIDILLKESKLLKEINNQTKLSSFV